MPARDIDPVATYTLRLAHLAAIYAALSRTADALKPAPGDGREMWVEYYRAADRAGRAAQDLLEHARSA